MLKKIVNGIEQNCSPQEEAEILAEWQANDPARIVSPIKSITVTDLDARLKVLEQRAGIIPVNGGAK